MYKPESTSAGKEQRIQGDKWVRKTESKYKRKHKDCVCKFLLGPKNFIAMSLLNLVAVYVINL